MRNGNGTKVLVRPRNGRMVAWVIIPQEGEKTPAAENIVSAKQDASAGR
jgi:hypothetical protein